MIKESILVVAEFTRDILFFFPSFSDPYSVTALHPKFHKLERMCVITKPSFWFFVLLLLFVSHWNCFSIEGDTLLIGQSLSASQTLISQNGIFELGFFKPGASLNIYLGIWYKNSADKMIV